MAPGVGIGDRFSIQLVKIHRKRSHGLQRPTNHNLQGIQSDENGISYRISRDFCCALMGFKMGLQLLKILEDVMGFHGGIMGDFPTKSIIMGHIPGNLLRLRPGSHGPFSQI